MKLVRVAIAGSTGSIGTQTIDVIEQSAEQYEIVGLGVGSSTDAVIAQAKKWKPKMVAVADDAARKVVASELRGVEVVRDMGDLARDADVVINGVVGFAGLPVTIATLQSGKRLGLANKESLIAAGPIVQPLRRNEGAVIVPVDSEHCAIHQCLRSSADIEHEVKRLLLTASGGPFRGRQPDWLETVTVNDALRHPTWTMGPKITVDSSTLMNKGLEVIEAHELFGIDYDHIDVVVHPQSIVHSMVEFRDGAVIAQMSLPDMRLPIAYALGYPARSRSVFGAIDWSSLSRLDFEPPDRASFRCLDLAYVAGRVGGIAPAWLSAANEVGVAAFLDGRIGWSRIAEVIEQTMQSHDQCSPTSIEDILAADLAARRFANEVIAR